MSTQKLTMPRPPSPPSKKNQMHTGGRRSWKRSRWSVTGTMLRSLEAQATAPQLVGTAATHSLETTTSSKRGRRRCSSACGGGTARELGVGVWATALTLMLADRHSALLLTSWLEGSCQLAFTANPLCRLFCGSQVPLRLHCSKLHMK